MGVLPPSERSGTCAIEVPQPTNPCHSMPSLTMAHKRRMPMIPQLHKTVILNASWIEVDVHLN
jgi:hypothetical protein